MTAAVQFTIIPCDPNTANTVNSLCCGHPLDRELVSLIAGDRNSRNLFQPNICNLFLPGI